MKIVLIIFTLYTSFDLLAATFKITKTLSKNEVISLRSSLKSLNFPSIPPGGRVIFSSNDGNTILKCYPEIIAGVGHRAGRPAHCNLIGIIKFPELEVTIEGLLNKEDINLIFEGINNYNFNDITNTKAVVFKNDVLTIACQNSLPRGVGHTSGQEQACSIRITE